MTEVLKYLIVAGTLLILGAMSMFYQLFKNGAFKVTVEVEDNQAGKPKIDVEVLTEGLNESELTRSDLLKALDHNPYHNPAYKGISHTGRLMESLRFDGEASSGKLNGIQERFLSVDSLEKYKEFRETRLGSSILKKSGYMSEIEKSIERMLKDV